MGRELILSPDHPRVHAVECGWLDAMRTVELFAYRLPAEPFRPVSVDRRMNLRHGDGCGRRFR